ncbi:MAG: dTMP kinase [Candidatus Margulisiibacteriota bacterium]
MLLPKRKRQKNGSAEVILPDQSRNMEVPHPYKGVLVAVEGTDGSGKSTQLHLAKKWLESEGYGTVLTIWNSSALVSKIIKKGKKKGILDNTTFSLLHATDFADRLNNVIIPALKEGRVVLADRYIFTALARDVARACERKWVRNLYSFAVKPDRTFYFKVPVEMSLDRILVTRTPNYYEAGMDMNLSSNLYENYLKFQGLVITEYDSMVEEFNFEVIDGTLAIPFQQKLFRDKIIPIIQRKFG